MTTNSVRNAVATRDQRGNAAVSEFMGKLAALQPEIAKALPVHMNAQRMARIVMTEIRKNPKLAECTFESFAGALLTSSALGLEPGLNGEAYLVPYGRECQFIVGYQGLVKLFWQHPLAAHIDAQAVFAGDDFDYAYGLHPFLRHKPALGDRDEVTCYYAVARLTTGAKAFVVLSPEQVKALRQGKVGPDSRFKAGDPMRWMERKTALRQLIKTLPRSTQLNQAIEVDEVKGSTLRNRQIARDQFVAGLPAVPDMAPHAPAPEARQDVPPAGVDASTGEAGPEYVDPLEEEPPW